MLSLTRKSLLATALAATLLGSVLGPAAAGASSPSLDPTLKVHPLLQYGAQTEPTKMVRAIVQMANPDAHVDDLAHLVGGRVDEKFKVIPAAVLDITQAAALTLARNPDVRYVTFDGPVRKHATIDTGNLTTTYPLDVEAPSVWNGAVGGIGATGDQVTVAVVDTGLDRKHSDFHLIHRVDGNRENNLAHVDRDAYGHGTHVASIIAAHSEDGKYVGIAPDAKVIGVQIADDSGIAIESDLLRGLDWVWQHERDQHIRVVNLSVGIGIAESYATSPVDAAVERLWHDGVVIVAAAGNLGTAEDAVFYAPANDPFVITVGCLDTTTIDHTLCPISSRGITEDGFAKPDVVAPGRRIIAALSAGPDHGSAVLAQKYGDRITSDGHHIRLSGTSMATPVVSGVAALLLQRFPTLTPDQVKGVLTGSTHRYSGQSDGAGMVDALAAFQAAAAGRFPALNPGLAPLPGVNPAAGIGTVSWDGARWGSAYWDGARWGSAYWDGARWGSAYWDGARWGSAYWDGARWGNAAWDDESHFD